MRSEIDTTIHPGTKDNFRGWLLTKKSMNYTSYTKLSLETKSKIQKEYKVDNMRKIKGG